MKKETQIAIVVVLVVGIAWLAYEYSAGTGAVNSALQSAFNPEGSGGSAATILTAISSFENVASQHNNPGGMCGGYDASGNCTGPATYSSLAAGEAAAQALIAKIIASNPGITVADFVKKWSGASGDVLSNYQNSVSDSLGLNPNDPISSAGGDETSDADGGIDLGDDDFDATDA